MTESTPVTRRVRHILLIALAMSLLGCSATTSTVAEPRSSAWNPLGWPAKGVGWVGSHAADSGWLIARDVGRVLTSTALLAETPALLVEGVVTVNGSTVVGGLESAVAGCGTVITSLWNVPFFWIPGRDIDLARDVELVNDALEYLESHPIETWRFDPDDDRTFIFPHGTRARATANGHLIFTIPGHGEVLQVAESNALWHGLQSLFGTNFPAQERSWGFIVRTAPQWYSRNARWRASTILHELYHQHAQMREWLLGWNPIYWPAYMGTFMFTGWNEHWAEMRGAHSAGVVDRGLRAWLFGR